MLSEMQTSQPSALFLLADSQLLFWKEARGLFLNRVRDICEKNNGMTDNRYENIKKISFNASYIGASNGDLEEYYQIFVAAMDGIGISHCQQISKTLSMEEQMFLRCSDVILLAGGDTWLGWKTIAKLKPILIDAYRRGTVLMGVSAGAIHLGQLGWRQKSHLVNTDLFSTLDLAHFIIGAHEENSNWHVLQQVVGLTGGCVPAVGIAQGGGLIVMPDQSIQVVRKPALKLVLEEHEYLTQTNLQPDIF